MNKQELAKGVYFVGAMDWNMRDFHGYTTPRGVTYNSYLIVDEKICLVDLVKSPFANELLERISAIVDPATIDYVVINHVEPDHASALPQREKQDRARAYAEWFRSRGWPYVGGHPGKLPERRRYGYGAASVAPVSGRA